MHAFPMEPFTLCKSLAVAEMVPEPLSIKKVQDFALLPITLTGYSIHPGVSGISRLAGRNPPLGPQSLQQNSNSVNRFGLCLEPLLGSMALSGTGTLVASLVSKITASTAMAKAGGAVSGTILAGFQSK